MSTKISENTNIQLDLKTVVAIIMVTASFVGMYYTLQADIEEAKKLPIPPDPEITRMEFDMKDQLVRQTIMSTQQDVTEIKEDIKRIEEKIDQLR